MKKIRECNDYFLFLLSKRDYSLKEIESKGLLKGFTKKEIQKSISQLIELNYLNDERYCENIIENYKNIKGKNWVYQKLLQKKIPVEIINREISNHIFWPNYSIKQKFMTKFGIKSFDNITIQTKSKILAKLISAGYDNSYEILNTWKKENK
jgi:regulatory protein